MTYTMRFFLFSSLLAFLFLTSCNTSSPTAKVIDFPTELQDQSSADTQSTDIQSSESTAIFCEMQKFGVRGRDEVGTIFEYNNSCLGRVWYHSYACVNNEVVSSNVKCENGCNLFGCEE